MEGQIVCFTVTDASYLTRALALHESLSRAGESPIELLVYCLDEAAERLLRRSARTALEVIAFREIEVADAELLSVRASRTTAEYSWTAKPTMARDVFNRRADATLVAYLDADMAFYDDPRQLFAESSATQFLTPHRFSPHYRHLERVGTFNAGFVGLKRSPQATRALDWWRERCLEWCSDRPDRGRFADQAYLNFWPQLFPDTAVIADPGANLGPWNWAGHRIESGAGSDDRPRIDGRPTTLVHYHGIRVSPSGDVAWRPGGYLMDGAQTDVLLRPYTKSLHRSTSLVRSLEPGFCSGFSSPLSSRDRLLGGLARAANRLRRRFPVLSRRSVGRLALPGRGHRE